LPAKSVRLLGSPSRKVVGALSGTLLLKVIPPVM
jgi:hypothetical protein